MSDHPHPQSLFLFPEKLIGRDDELAAIHQAIDSHPYTNQVYYFVGAGGTGKTRLLNEANDYAHSLRKVLSTGVIDLFHTRYHQRIMLISTLARRLSWSLKHTQSVQDNPFPRFNEAKRRYESMQAKDLAQINRDSKVIDTFFGEYEELARRYPIVLQIDSFEKVHLPIPELTPFTFAQRHPLDLWILEQITDMPNTLTLIAGRPREDQMEALRHNQILQPRLHIYSIKPFVQEQTVSYVQSCLPAGHSFDDEVYKLLQSASGGRPVLLSILMARVQIAGFDPQVLLADLSDSGAENVERLGDLFLREIMKDITIRDTALAEIFTKAVYLRKGVHAALLRRIASAEDSVPELDGQLERLRRLPFVKVTGQAASYDLLEDDTRIVLHDEIYELLFGKVDERQSPMWYREAVAFLGEKLDEVRKPASQSEQADPLQKYHTLLVESLFYKMALDPRAGYQDYRELAMSTVQIRDDDFDLQLQDLLALFFDPDTPWGKEYRKRAALAGLSWRLICYEEAIRWIYRRIKTQGETRYQAAIDLARRIEAAYADIYQHNEQARCALDIARLQAEIYIADKTGRGQQIVVEYKQTTEKLEQLQQSGMLHDADLQNGRMLLASAYADWGYYERTSWRLRSAVEKYEQAIKLYKQLGAEGTGARAITLNDLAFALSRQGDMDKALRCSQRALEIFESQGARYSVATALNTLAQIQLARDKPDEALELVKQAQQIFLSTESIRHLGLSYFAEGNILRWLAYRDRHDPPKSLAEYDQASACYQQALKYFRDGQQAELFREVEALQGLGCAYRSRGYTQIMRGEREAGLVNMRHALDWFDQALTRCDQIDQNNVTTPSVLRTRILEDVAVAYVDQGDYHQARQQLEKVRKAIPPAYDVRPYEGITETLETREQQTFWLILAHAELQHGLCAFGTQDYSAAIEHFLKAFACAYAFSKQVTTINTLRILGAQELQKIQDLKILLRLRDEFLPWHAPYFKIEKDAVAEMEQLIGQAIENIELL